jgi:hypothetical protein
VIFKSHFPIFWKILAGQVVFILLVNIIFAGYLTVISFFNLFLLLIPNLYITFFLYRFEIRRVKNFLTEYMEKNQPEKLKLFYENYHSDSNPGEKPIFALFTDKELLKDNLISQLKAESEKLIFLLVATGALTIMVFLISTVFIMRSKYRY